MSGVSCSWARNSLRSYPPAGSLCGVQSGLQSAMDLLKFGLVVALPEPRMFGVLVILSFLVGLVPPPLHVQFVGCGGLLFLVYTWTRLYVQTVSVCGREDRERGSVGCSNGAMVGEEDCNKG